VTDPAGKWKKYASDAFGRLTQVNEPNPAGGADYVTNYTYDLLDHLTQVSMPRPSGTQTRTFNYGTPPGPFLLSATNPENGTVSERAGYSVRLPFAKQQRQTGFADGCDSGEQITYTYDALNRLATAVTSDNPSVTQWGQSYTFDGFGNLTDQNVIKGSAPTMHVVYNASSNRLTGDTADLNGNIGSGYSYDIENRLLKAGTGMPQYGYDAGNKRIARDTEFTFWAGNQKWETYHDGGERLFGDVHADRSERVLRRQADRQGRDAQRGDEFGAGPPRIDEREILSVRPGAAFRHGE